ncbi:hypothetical protein EON63_02585 [archaeon]|nr:MAG: hypothetical protein EON63_02585 [archaeon]
MIYIIHNPYTVNCTHTHTHTHTHTPINTHYTPYSLHHTPLGKVESHNGSGEIETQSQEHDDHPEDPQQTYTYCRVPQEDLGLGQEGKG